MTATERHVLAGLFPHPLEGLAPALRDEILDAWFVADHYAGNPVYTWNDNESAEQ
jgi:hypothetical protein